MNLQGPNDEIVLGLALLYFLDHVSLPVPLQTSTRSLLSGGSGLASSLSDPALLPSFSRIRSCCTLSCRPGLTPFCMCSYAHTPLNFMFIALVLLACSRTMVRVHTHCMTVTNVALMLKSHGARACMRACVRVSQCCARCYDVSRDVDVRECFLTYAA